MMRRRLKPNPCPPGGDTRRRWMRRLVFPVCVAVVFLAYGWLAEAVLAAIVYYYDEQGRIHYINTDYMKVPERYRWQVEEQLRRKGLMDDNKKESRKETVGSTEENETSSAGRSAPASVDPFARQKVEFFTRPGCAECYRLEMLLRAHKIPYVRYDITCVGKECPRSPYGIPSGTPPMTRVGDVVIQGKDIQKISEAYEAMIAAQEEPAVEQPRDRERKRRR